MRSAARLDADCALEIEHFVHPHADRRAAGALWRQVDLGRAVLNAIDVASEFRSVVNGSHVMPLAEIVQVPVGTVMSRLYHARRMLTKRLAAMASELRLGNAVNQPTNELNQGQSRLSP